jgi:hypothetical protein
LGRFSWAVEKKQLRYIFREKYFKIKNYKGNHGENILGKNIVGKNIKSKNSKKMKKYEGTYFHLKRCGAIGLFSLFLSSGILFFLLSFIRPDNFLFLLFPRF